MELRYFFWVYMRPAPILPIPCTPICLGQKRAIRYNWRGRREEFFRVFSTA
jgi:hypothetical protein